MIRKSLGIMAAMLMLAGHGRRDIYAPPRQPHAGESDDERKDRYHRMNPAATDKHEYIIKGERILASNRKTALKIYANHHPQNKKRKKK
jgi:hypothetical protein